MTSDIKVILPKSKNEQQKIAEVLGTMDEDITKTQEVIEATEKLKRGLMQQLFTRGIGHTKFKETKIGQIPEEWEAVQIKNSPIKLIDGDRGINYPKLSDFTDFEFTTGGYCLFLSNKNIKDDKFIFSELQFISRDKDELLRAGKLQREDVVLTTRGTVGNVAFYDNTITFQNIRINSGMLILRAFDGIEPVFLFHLMKSSLLKKRYKEIVSGSAQPQLPVGILEQVYIPIPPEDEQKKIAEILSAVDEKISVNKRLKEKLTLLKKGLMQDLLSGRVRTNIPICYWCGKDVEDNDGAREHLVPGTLLKDTNEDLSEFIISKENAHKSCNQMLANSYEHDFCQIVFYYSLDDEEAVKHTASKKKNLESKLEYARKQFQKMKKVDNRTEIQLSQQDKIAFETCIRKIIKGLFFKIKNRYLDLESDYSLRIVWNTFNLESDHGAQEQVKSFLSELNDQIFQGNSVFKYRFKEVNDGKSSLWEFLFYNRFPVYSFLIYKDDRNGF